MRGIYSVMMCGFGLALCAITVVSAQNPGGSAEGKKLKNPISVSAESLASGKAAFEKNCKFCHGTSAKGDGSMAPKDSHPSDLTDATWERGSTDGEIFLVVQNGAGPEFKMKGLKGRMTDTDIWNVVNYVRSLGPQTKK